MSRHVLREQNDRAEKIEQTDDTADSFANDDEPPISKTKKPRAREAAVAKPAQDKAPAKPRARKKSVLALPRMFAYGALCDNAMKPLALFDDKDRQGADAKLIEMKERKPRTP
jgi:hypothetical protein